MRIKRYYRVRAKICNTGIAMLLICLFLSLVVCFLPQYLPAYVYALVITVLTLVQAFYIETVEKEV